MKLNLLKLSFKCGIKAKNIRIKKGWNAKDCRRDVAGEGSTREMARFY